MNTVRRRENITVRGQSYVLRLPNIDPPPPSPPRECVPPAFVAGGGHTRRVGGGGVNIFEDARHSSVLYLYRILFAARSALL
jgi:hypothetical protein